MAQPAHTQSHTLASGWLFGIPLGELGWFASLLMGLASGFIAFFGATFLAIFSILIWNSAGHHAVDFQYSYTRIGLPIGLIVMFVALAYLAMLWLRRKLRRA